MPVLMNCDIICERYICEKYICNKLNDRVINSYFKLQKSKKTCLEKPAISFNSFLFHKLGKSKVSSLFKMYLKYGHLLKKIYTDSS